MKPCGTRAAYLRHQRNGETPCDECRAANNEYAARLMRRRRAETDEERRQREGRRIEQRLERAQRRIDEKAAAAERRLEALAPCGTNAAHQRHLRNGETPCDECKAAHALHARPEAARRRGRLDMTPGKPQMVLDALRRGCSTAGAAAEDTGLARSTAEWALHRLADDGLAVRTHPAMHVKGLSGMLPAEWKAL